MKNKRLTARDVTRAISRGCKYEISCGVLKGFFVRVLASGKKVYYVRYRTPENRDRRERIGLSSQVSFADARRIAVERLTSNRADVQQVRAPTRLQSRGTRSRPVHTMSHDQEDTSPLMRDFAERFVNEHVRVRLKPGSHYKYPQLLRTMILPAFADRRLHEIRRAEVIRWHAAKHRTPSEANNGLAVLKSLYSRAIEWGVLPEDFTSPATKVKKFPENARERFLTPDERERLERFFDSVAGKKFGRGGGFRWETICALRLLAHTGMRRSEVLGLTWAMVDWNHRHIYLPDSKTGRRPVPLSSRALELLREARARNNPSPFVVPSSKGTAIKGIVLYQSWTKIRARVGLEDVRIHDLRHSAASDAINAGVPLAVVGKILGHRKASTTQRYAHLSDQAVANGVELMGRSIAKAERRRPAAKRSSKRTRRPCQEFRGSSFVG